MHDHKSKDYTGEFYGAPVDYRDEYVQARKLMGQKGTDLDVLSSTVGFLYLHCPDHIAPQYAALLHEITSRSMMLLFTRSTTA